MVSAATELPPALRYTKGLAMKRRKPGKQSKDEWRARALAIASADRLFARAKELTALTSADGDPKRTREQRLQAALFEEAAARAYIRGSLGLMARHAFADARDHYLEQGHEAGAARCTRLRTAVPFYWPDDGGIAGGHT